VRIVIACPYAWDAPGGVQVHVRQLRGHLVTRGHQVLVLAPSLGRADEDGLVVVGRARRVRYQGTVSPICFSPPSVARIRAALHSFRPDVVHVHEPLTPSTGMFAALLSRPPVVATFHAYAERSGLYTAAAPLLNVIWRKLAVRIAVSRAAGRFVGKRFRGEVRVIPNGCDVDLFAGATPSSDLPSGRRVLWTHRLDPQKGFRTALGAFRLLAEEHPDLWLVVAGDGSDRAGLRTLPEATRNRVVMLGAVPHGRLPAYHAGANVFIAPAVGQESFGMVLVEAMAAGVPVVASDIPGYAEVATDGVDALLFPPGDAGAMAVAVRRLLDDPGLAEGLRQRGRANAERFRWERVIPEVESTYREAVESRSNPR
jgi:phosphatidyl-myo-inositol alpha-mannosyltransferase